MNILYKIFKEPLVHFLLIGSSLFFIYTQTNQIQEIQAKSIHITKEKMTNLSLKFVNAKGREPTKIEKKELIDNYIKEEVLYQEAIKKGLDINDKTIRLHLVKKMQYVFDNLSFSKEPTDIDLQNFLQNNNSKFINQEIISFNQIVFTKNKNFLQDIEKESTEFLKRLQNKKNKRVSQIGDTVKLSKKKMQKLFDKKFADTIFNLETNKWLGPIKSKYGLHLIYIHSKTKSTIPKLKEIKDKVSIQWRKAQLDIANKKFYKNLYRDYKIIIDKDAE